MRKRLAIIGAGPTGIEAALSALEQDYEVQVFERGDIGQNVREWGHVRMFTPFLMNRSVLGLRGVPSPPGDDELLFGKEYVERYLIPAAGPVLPMVHTHTEVLSVARVATLKAERVNDRDRGARPFRIHLRGSDGKEWFSLSDIVFDCSGVWRTPNPAGDGGMVALGEHSCGEFLTYGVPDLSGARRDRYTGKDVLIIGNGHSAATAVRDLAPLAATIVWATRRSECVALVPDDPLPGRRALQEAALAIVRSGRARHLPEQGVLSFARHKGRVRVTFTNEHGKVPADFDRVVVCTGFHPDLSIARELQLSYCWATEASFGLWPGVREGAPLVVPSTNPVTADSLRHPEPGFFTLGVKSYGRMPDFLIETGLRQVAAVLAALRS